MRYDGRAGYDLVSARRKKVEERLAYFFGSHVKWINNNEVGMFKEGCPLTRFRLLHPPHPVSLRETSLSPLRGEREMKGESGFLLTHTQQYH
jgi:hypothetical protein